MADRVGRLREGGLIYFSILLYIAFSVGQIFFNKWVLSSKQRKFPYPVGLSLPHMVFSSILCFIVKVEGGMSLEIYATSVIPIGAMFAIILCLGNSAYLYISVAFSQMLKAVMPVAVMILGVVAGLEVLSCRMFFIMCVISFGLIVVSYGEVSVSWIGVVYEMGGVIGEALRLIFMEIFVKRKGIRLNSICHVLCQSMQGRVVVLLSALLFADSKLTVLNLIGYGIGVAANNNHKLKKEASRTISDENVNINNEEPEDVQIILHTPKEDG